MAPFIEATTSAKTLVGFYLWISIEGFTVIADNGCIV